LVWDSEVGFRFFGDDGELTGFYEAVEGGEDIGEGFGVVRAADEGDVVFFGEWVWEGFDFESGEGEFQFGSTKAETIFSSSLIF